MINQTKLEDLHKIINKLESDKRILKNALEEISEKGTSCHFIAIAKEALATIKQNIRIIHTRQCSDDEDLNVQFFEVLNVEKPYRVRLIDKNTGEIGPQIRMYDSFDKAAIFYANNSPLW